MIKSRRIKPLHKAGGYKNQLQTPEDLKKGTGYSGLTRIAFPKTLKSNRKDYISSRTQPTKSSTLKDKRMCPT